MKKELTKETKQLLAALDAEAANGAKFTCPPADCTRKNTRSLDGLAGREDAIAEDEYDRALLGRIEAARSVVRERVVQRQRAWSSLAAGRLTETGEAI